MLDDLSLKLRYRTGDDDLLEDFFLPCLRQATTYSRAVGYFSSHALAAAAEGLPAFIANGGTMRLVASPDLSDDDVDAIQQGYVARDEVVRDALLRVLRGEHPDPVRERLGFLAWLVANDRLDIKIAVLEGGGAGIYHEKIGIFGDDAGGSVAFQGSANESRGGLITNFESLLVFRSAQKGQRPVIDAFADDFERLWADTTPTLDVMPFPEAVKEELLTRYHPSRLPVSHDNRDAPPAVTSTAEETAPAIPSGRGLRDYQRDALAAWFRNEGRGMFQMATGTGKTITALALLTNLYNAVVESGRTLTVVILCPYQHLVSQWGREAERFNLDPILCFRSRATWFDRFAAHLSDATHGDRKLTIAIATNATFQTNAFQQLVGRFPEDTLIIADEVHNVGAPGLRELLPATPKYRLGLSATPERWYDEEGTEALTEYFGPVVYELGLEDAIRLKALTPYDYHPVVVELGGDELDSYLEITRQIGSRVGQGGGMDDGDPILEALLIKRARILSVAHGKLGRLRALMAPLAETSHNLFYCGDGQVEYAPGGETVRQLDAVVHILGQDLGMSVNSYTAETYLDDRDVLRQRFADGSLQGLVAIRCLDEGVDIPETRTAFILASSTNPKQFIQRRGRVLRLHDGKTKAAIYDFVVVPPSDSISADTFAVERRLVRRELERVARFAQLAVNGPVAMAELESLRKTYDLLHI